MPSEVLDYSVVDFESAPAHLKVVFIVFKLLFWLFDKTFAWGQTVCVIRKLIVVEDKKYKNDN